MHAFRSASASGRVDLTTISITWPELPDSTDTGRPAASRKALRLYQAVGDKASEATPTNSATPTTPPANQSA